MLMSIFIKMMSGAALMELAGLEAHMKATLRVDFVSFQPDKIFNCRGFLKCGFMAKSCSRETKISLESSSRFLCMTGSDSVIEGKTEGTASFLNCERRNIFLNYNLRNLNVAIFSD